MNARMPSLFLLGIALMFVVVLPGHAQSGITLNNADAVRQQAVSPYSGPSSSIPRVILQYANTMRQAALAAPPAGLQTLVGQVVPRIILQYANTGRQMTLAYPKALMSDTVPPQIRDVRVASGAKITWTTDEFATSEVRYGTAPGVYTQTASDPLYEKAHSLTLIGLTAGRTYYFIVRAADRSGNQAQSGEYQVKGQTRTYLPLIRRQ